MTSDCSNTFAYACANVYKTNMCKKSEFAALMFAIICCYLISDFVAQIICEKIEARQAKMKANLIQDLNYRDTEIQAMQKENQALQKENQRLKEEVELLNILTSKEKELSEEKESIEEKESRKQNECL